MIIQKWDEKLKKYEDYTIPNDWKIPLYSDDMNEKINCVCCGKEITFGEGYTSHRFHNNHGFGYYECEDCYYKYLPTYLHAKQ